MPAIEKIFKQITTSLRLLVNSSVSLLKVVFKSSFNLKLPKAEKKSCFILGNGPSLKESLGQNLEEIKKHDLICVNNFAYSEYFEILKPRYYVLLDPFYFNYDQKVVDSIESVRSTFEKFKTVDWPIIFLLPSKGKKSQLVTTILNTNKNIKIYYFNYVVIEGFTKFKNFIFEKNLGTPQCQNVLSVSLFLSLNFGYEKIYLLGADHSWHEEFSVQKNNKIVMEVSHFYNKAIGQEIPKGRIAEYRSNVTDFFLSLYKVFRSYDIIKRYAEYKKVKIYNASAKSYIDAFDKIELKDIKQ